MKKRKPIWVLVVSAFAAFLATFNETFLNIAFTPIMEDFNVSVSTVQWLTTAYMLGAAIMVPISSFLFRKVSTKPLFLFTVFIMIVGSVIGSVAPNFTILLIGRIIQAIGTGALVPISMNLTMSVVPKEKIGTYMGIMGAATTLGPSLSIISAGLILSLGRWQYLFYVFTAFTIILFILGSIILVKIPKSSKEKLDISSTIYISLALIGILYGISGIFGSNIIIAICSCLVGIISLFLFIKRSGKIANPIVNLNPLKIPAFRVGIISNMMAIMVVFAMNIILPLYMQSAMGVKAFIASLTLFPAIICSCIVSPISGKIYDKDGAKRILPFGFILVFIFTLLIGLIRDANSLLLIGILYVPVICGSAIIIGPAQSFALSSLDKKLNSHGVTMISTGFQVAGCIGSSIFTGVYSLTAGLGLSSGMSNSKSVSIAFLLTMVVAAIIAILGFINSLLIKKIEKNNKVIVSNNVLNSIMKKDVYTAFESDTLLEVMKKLSASSVSGMPVLNSKGNLTGFISDGDIMRYLSKSHPLFNSPYFLAINAESGNFDDKLNSLMKSKVKDIMKKKLITIDAGTDLDEVCNIMISNHLKKAPVVSSGKLIGVINRSNITKYAIDKYLKAQSS